MSPTFEEQRLRMVRELQSEGYLVSEGMIQAMKIVPREKFMAKRFRNHAYSKYSAFPIPPFTGHQTISAPNTYPLFYEPLNFQKGDVCLEVGTGSGYGAALLQEIVGKEGKIVTIEFNERTFEFGRANLKNAGYDNVVIIQGDGSKGYPSFAPYDKIIVTAQFHKVPEPLKEQMATPGKVIMPVKHGFQQILTLLEKDQKGEVKKKLLDRVLYVPLKGEYGYKP